MHSILQTIISNGVPVDLVYFLLTVSFVVMVATFARHVLGMKVMEMHVILSVSYVLAFLLRDNSLFSISLGLGVILFIYFFSYYIKRLTLILGLHYFARISVVITMISILLLAALFVAGQYPNLIDLSKLNLINPLGIVLAVLLSEHFSSNQTQKGIKKSRFLFFNSLFLSLLVSLTISWYQFEWALLRYPYVIVLFMLLTFLFGRYKGMRVSEFARFRDIKLDRE